MKKLCSRLSGIGALALLCMSLPAFAEIDLSGDWAARVHEDNQERVSGPAQVEYWGLPINDQARKRALAYSPSQLSILERQCLYYTPYYWLVGPFGGKIWADYDRVTGAPVAWNISAVVDRAQLVIWMDGRPHPGPNALHTDSGFSTGRWEGNTLVVTTTHMKEGYLRRNGVPVSDQATLTMYITRHGTDTLTVTGMIDDPVYLTEPMILTRMLKLNPELNVRTISATCTPDVEIPDVDNGKVPHILPGQNTLVGDLKALYHVPVPAILGGANTMYPEYRAIIKEEGYTPPEACTRYCCGWGSLPAPNESVFLQCKGGL